MSRIAGEPTSSRERLIRAVTDVVAESGVVAATAKSIGLRSGLGPGAAQEHFGSVELLLLVASRVLSEAPVLPLPDAELGSSIRADDGRSPREIVGQVLESLLSAHRSYVNDDPIRFAAIVQLAAAGIVGQRALVAPIGTRNRQTQAAARAHLGLLHRAGLLDVATVDLATVAETLVDTASGIELCHLVEDDEQVRDAAYRALHDWALTSLRVRAEAGVRQASPTADQAASLASLTFSADYRLQLLLDPDGTVRDVLAVDGVLRWESSLLLGRFIETFSADGQLGQEQSDAWRQRIADAHLQPGPTTYTDRRPNQNAEDRPRVLCTVTPIRSRDGELDSILVDLQDHTARLETDEMRREVTDQLGSALELTGLGRYVAYVREPRMDTNDRFDAIYGRDCQDLMEREGIDGFFNVIHAEDRPVVRAALEAAMTGEIDYVANYRLWALRDDGPELRWIEALGRVESDADGPWRIIGVVEDVTDRRRAQDAQLRTQKREAIGSLAAGIAHDFNNVIGAVLANAVVAASELERGLSPATSIHEIERGARRSADLVQRLLAFSREEEPKRAPVDLAIVVSEACALLRPTLGVNIELCPTILDDLPHTVGDATQLHQVVLNLILNADHAIGASSGRIDVMLDVEQVRAAAEGAAELTPGDYLRLRVKDDGPGIPERLEQRIFDPFFTTKPSGESTGLGLSSSQTIVGNHGGAITVQGSPGEGALFTVLLPCKTARHPSGLSSDGPFDEPAGPPVQVLFVDDEIALGSVAQRAMPAYGCEALAFSDPHEALEVFRDSPDRFDVVITDLAMPTMDGLRFIQEIRALRPQIPVMLTSGFVPAQAQNEARQLRVDEVIIKPWSVDELVEKTVALAERARAADRS